MKRLLLLIILALTLFVSIPASAQQDTCPTIVQQALDEVDSRCYQTAVRNQACYGNVTVHAEPQPDIGSLDFDAPGDTVNVTDIQSLRLSAMDENVPEWGVALLRLQADLPNTLPGQNVTVVLFGDVEIQAATLPPQTEVTINTSSTINVRAEPSTSANVVTGLVPNTTVIANGRDETGEWLRLDLPTHDNVGWVHIDLVDSEEEIDTLDVVTPGDPVLRPFQAFYFQSGIGDSYCAEAPESGILIRSRVGSGQISLLINEVTVTLGSAVFVQAQPGDSMAVYFISGTEVSVTALGETQSIFRGSRVTIPIDDNLQPVGPPGLPEPYTEDQVDGLPMRLVGGGVATPLTEEAIAERIADRDPCRGTAMQNNSNVRRGPGTDYATASQMETGDNRRIAGQITDTDGDLWYQFTSTQWIHADLIELNEHCDDIPVLPAEEIPPVPTPVPTAAPGEPACGVIFDFAGPNFHYFADGTVRGSGLVLTDWIYLLTGQQVNFTVSGAGQTWQGLRLKVFGPSGTIFNLESRTSEGGEAPLSRTFIAEEDGWYYLEGDFGGGPDTTGSIFAEATCP